MRGLALYGLDQVRDQIVALLELHVDIGKGLADALTERDQTVIRAEPAATWVSPWSGAKRV
jgi:hypothetical protein